MKRPQSHSSHCGDPLQFRTASPKSTSRPALELSEYVSKLLAVHLAEAGDHERLWRLLQDETFRQAQLRQCGNYEAAVMALRAGAECYANRNGCAVDDDARLCWLALRAGALSWQAQSDLRPAFDAARHLPLGDPQRIHRVLPRLEPLGTVAFHQAICVLLWIESQRQTARPSGSSDPTPALQIIEAARRRLSKQDGWVWRDAPKAVTLIAGLAIWLLRFVPGDAVAWLLTVLPPENRERLIEHLCHALGGEPPRCRAGILVLALSLTASMKEEYPRETALASIARAAEKASLFSEATQAIDGFGNAALRSSFLAAAATALAGAGKVEAALRLARQIAEPQERTSCLRDVAVHLAHSGQTPVVREVLVEALDSALLVDPPGDRAYWFVQIAGKLQENGDSGRCCTFLKKALVLVKRIGNPKERRSRLCEIAAVLGTAGARARQKAVFAQALASARKIANADERADSFCLIADGLAAAGWDRWALKIVGLSTQAAFELDDPLEASGHLEAAATFYATHGEYTKAINVCEHIRDPHSRMTTLLAIGEKNPEWPSGADAEAYLRASSNGLARIKSRNDRSRFAGELVATLAKMGMLAEARRLTTSVRRVDTILVAAALSNALATSGRFSDALAVASDAVRGLPEETANDERLMWQVLLPTAVAEQCFAQGAVAVAEEILVRAQDSARAIKDHQRKHSALEGIALAYADAGRFDEACETAQRVGVDVSLPQGPAGWLAFRVAESFHTNRCGVLQKLVDLAIEQRNASAALRICGKIATPAIRSSAAQRLSVLLASQGDTEEAVRIANRIEDEQIRRAALLQIAARIAERSGLPAGFGVLEQGLLQADVVDVADVVAPFLPDIARELAKRGWAEEALAVITRVRGAEYSDEMYRLSLISDLSDTLAEAGYTNEALQVATGIPDELRRDHRRRRIASVLARKGLHEAMFNVIATISDREVADRARQEVADTLAASGLTDAAVAVAEGIDGDSHSGFWHTRDDTFKTIIRHLLHRGDLQSAWSVIPRIKRPWYLAWSVQAIACEFTSVGMLAQAEEQMEHALSIADDIHDVDLKTRLLDSFIESLVRLIARLGEMAAVAHRQRDKDDGAEPKACLRDRDAASVATHALAYAARFDGIAGRARALTLIAGALARSGQLNPSQEFFDRAVAAATSIQDPGERVRAMDLLGLALVQTGQPPKAVSLAAQIRNRKARAAYLARVAGALTEAGDLIAGNELYQTAESLIIGRTDRNTGTLLEMAARRVETLLAAGAVTHARAMLSRISPYFEPLPDEKRAAAALRFSTALARAGFFEDARELVACHIPLYLKSSFVKHLVRELLEEKSFGPALEMLRRFQEVDGVSSHLQSIAQQMSRKERLSPNDLMGFPSSPGDLGISLEAWREIRPFWHQAAAKAGPEGLPLLRRALASDLLDQRIGLSATAHMCVALLRQREDAMVAQVLLHCPQLERGFTLDPRTTRSDERPSPSGPCVP